MPYLHGDSLIQEHVIYIELDKDFFDLELESFEDYFLDLVEEDVQELDFD